MRYYEVSPFKVTHRLSSVLTYASPEKLAVGQLVSVEVGAKTVASVVTREVKQPDFDTKSIGGIIERTALPTPLVKLNAWLSEYYATHPVHVWRTMLPSGLMKQRRKSAHHNPPASTRSKQSFALNSDQGAAVKTILEAKQGTHLLHGITGSGKTAVYIELAKQTVATGRSVIILVPEIALTSQLVADFTPFFPEVHVTHSTMTEANRHTLWQAVLNADTPQIIIGPRSALFMPVKELGLIVIDECHEPAFKQEQSPRYSALRAAAVLSKFAGAKLVLGSATPSVTDYYLASEAKAVVELSTLARTNAVKPSVSLVDMTKRDNFSRSSFLSNSLLDSLTETLASGHQALLFHNRRGSAPVTLCESCGWSATCPRCFTPLTLHADEYRLRCHLCNHTERIPTSCPSCHAADIIHKGIGTKRVEEEVRRLFPEARIVRFDGDTEAGVEKEYQALYDGEIDIIIGTQVIAKGLDLPHLRFVGVIQADSGLALPDYQSSERVFQLISQVTGRVGRNEHASRVVIQSYQPTHPSVEFGIAQDYVGFYDWCLTERRRAYFPPFCYLLRLTAVYKTEAGAVRASRALMATLRKSLPASVSILGPAPAFYERLRDTYRWQIILKSPKRSDLVKALELLPPKGWQSELDPVNLL
jgi:primosomal protein N' (replication factor Y)